MFSVLYKTHVTDKSLQGSESYLVLVVCKQYGRSVELAERVLGVNPNCSVQSF